LASHRSTEAAARAREAKQFDEDTQIRSAPPHVKEKIRGEHDRTIAEHERMARVHSRRASYAAEGFLLHSPSEATDGTYMKEHAALHSHMQRAGRVFDSADADGPDCC